MIEIESKKNGEKYSLEELYHIIELLRSPEGCPWDREQTLESLKPCVLEETYELLSAMDKPEDKARYDYICGLQLVKLTFVRKLSRNKLKYLV